ncbi:rhodanese-like domain-containing protein [Ottowia caeni]|uniref:rhodanese-like domain-containing protein n=1 Tax=Ottowia caeni TaxID=2870339 RepID=UPI001E283FB7|nr:sulfurtransferase [Ottowia caeni]
MSSTVSTISAESVRQWLNDADEIAFLDVREAGQFGEGHPFFAVNTPYSQLELLTPRLVPRKSTRIVLLDADDGVAERAVRRLEALGYCNLHILRGGAQGWSAAGYTLFQGVNLPSKTFGELIEHAFETPRISASELAEWQRNKTPFLLLDGRTLDEHRKMSIPGSVSAPNGELPRHLHELTNDAEMPVVIHCAGRTRSIVGAEILRNLGLPNPVFALENGTQGWVLAGLALDHGDMQVRPRPLQAHAQEREAATHFAHEAGVPQLSAEQAQQWIDDETHTTYLLDVRSAKEFAAGTLPGAVHTPGGQLLQTTDQTLGTRKSRVILLDDDGVRAPVIAAWLTWLGWNAATVDGGVNAALRQRTQDAGPAAHVMPRVRAQALVAWTREHAPQLVDLQASASYDRQHAAGAAWSIRPRLSELGLTTERAILVLAPDEETAQLAAIDLAEAGHRGIAWAKAQDWADAGLPVLRNTQLQDAERIDYLFFVHDRHEGNLDAARQYLEWETGLIAQAEPDELAVFRLPSRPASQA